MTNEERWRRDIWKWRPLAARGDGIAIHNIAVAQRLPRGCCRRQGGHRVYLSPLPATRSGPSTLPFASSCDP